jgi:hypothetical protein
MPNTFKLLEVFTPWGKLTSRMLFELKNRPDGGFALALSGASGINLFSCAGDIIPNIEGQVNATFRQEAIKPDLL